MANEKVFELPELTLKMTGSEKERLYAVLTVRAVRLMERLATSKAPDVGDWLVSEARVICGDLAAQLPVKLDPFAIALHLGMILGSLLEANAAATDNTLPGGKIIV